MILQRLEANPRLAVGVAVAVGLVWVFLLLDLADRLDAARRAERSAALQLERLRGVTGDERWPGLLDTVNQRLTAFRDRAWREDSEGLVQARMQDWLQEQLGAAGLVQRELSVSLPVPLEAREGVEAPPDMRLVTARLSVDFTPQGLNSLLARIAGSTHWVRVDRLLVRNWGNPTVELELSGLFIIVPAAPT